jgi:hypothetical protein
MFTNGMNAPNINNSTLYSKIALNTLLLDIVDTKNVRIIINGIA